MSTTTSPLVAELCLYGTHDTHVGAGYLGRTAEGFLFGTGAPEPGRIFTEAIWLAAGELRARGISQGLLRVFDAGGERVADLELGAFLPCYGEIRWSPAMVYAVNVDTLIAASQVAH